LHLRKPCKNTVVAYIFGHFYLNFFMMSCTSEFMNASKFACIAVSRYSIENIVGQSSQFTSDNVFFLFEVCTSMYRLCTVCIVYLPCRQIKP
jgi:hypothetical protein